MVGRLANARNGDTLLLTAGKLTRPMLQAITETDRVDHSINPRRIALGTPSSNGSDVLVQRRWARLYAWNEPDLGADSSVSRLSLSAAR